MPAFDLIKETATVTGTGAITLSGAVAGYRTFSSVYSDGDIMTYVVRNTTDNTWEIGKGTYNTSGNTISRTTLKSSSTGSPISFGAGNFVVYNGICAEDLAVISNPVNSTSADGLTLTTSNTASSGNQKWSPRMSWIGSGWKTASTAAAQSVAFSAECQPVQSTTNPLGNWVLSSNVNGAGNTAVLTVSTAGDITMAAGKQLILNSTNYISGNNLQITLASSNGVTLTNGTGAGTLCSTNVTYGLQLVGNGGVGEFQVVNVGDSTTSNYERFVLRGASGNFTIGTEAGGTGTARGLTITTNGTTAITIDTSQTVTFPGRVIHSVAGAASAPALTLTGTPNTGNATTSYPLFYINIGVTQPTTLSTGGTIIGANGPSGFAGNYLAFHTNGGSVIARITSAGALNLAAGVTCTTFSGTTVSGTTFTSSTLTASNIVMSDGSKNLVSLAILTGTNGGTGVNNGSSTITLGGNLIVSGAFATTLTVTATTSVTLPTTGTLVSNSVATVFTKQQNFQTVALTDGASIAWDVATAQNASVTLGGNRTMAAPSNLVDGGTYTLRVTQDGSGTRTLAYNAVFKWPGGSAPVLSTAIGAIDILTFISNGTNLYGTIQKAFA